MKLLRTTILLVAAFLIGGSTPSYSQSPEQIYQKGLMKEEGEGELLAAIDLYEQIADHSIADHSLRAKALLHIGMCYEKLGNQKAIKSYQRLINNYPGQKGEVAIARERLSRLKPIKVKVSKTSQSTAPLIPKFTKIKMAANPGNGVLSPDGKRSAFISEGNVWVMPVSGGVGPYIAGEPQKLTDNIGAWDMNGSYTWSGDGKWIAFNAEVDINSYSTSIYIVSSKGGIPQKIQVPEHRCGYPDEFRLSLSPDGKLLAYATGKNSGVDESKMIRIYTIPVNGGTPKELTGPWTQEPSFSPDGSKIAYVKNFKNDEGKRFSEVWIIPSAGGSPIPVSNLQSGHVGGPVWSADGKMIAFHRRPEGENPKEIWIVPVSEDGSPTKNPKKIELPLEAYHEVAGWTPDNKIGLQLMNPEYETIYTVPSAGGIATQVTPQGWTSYPKWSPDGEKIFFRWADGKIASVPSGGGAVDSIPIKSEFGIYTAVPGSGNDISPDGRTIVFSGTKNYYEKGKKAWEVDIFTIPVEGGEPKQLTTSGQLQDRFPCWSPDGNSIAFIRPQIKDNKPIFHIYIVTKEGENLTRITDESHNVAWAPIDWDHDGKSITYFSGHKTIKSISVDNGNSHVLTEINKVNNQFELAWSPGGTELAYTDKGKIWVLSTESGTTKEVKTGVEAMATKLGWSPNGKKIAFTAYAGGDHELWLMENFLPLEKLAQNAEAAEVAPKTPTLQKVWSGETTIMWGSPSPNGKFITYSDPSTLNLAIRHLSAGKTSVLTNDASENPLQFNMGSVVSPNSKQIAYSWYKNNHELRIIDVDNPQPKVIYGNKGEDIYPCAWSPDGKTIYAKSYLNNTRQCRILAISVLNGDVQVLKTFDGFYWLQLSVSPDNQFVAYHYPNNKNGEIADTDIHLISTDGKNETKLFEHPANDQVLGWFPDKNQILFKSDRSGTWDAWTAEVFKENAAAEPRRVLTEFGENISPMGFTNNGTFFYSLFSRKFDAFTASLDQTIGELKSESVKLLLGSIRNAKWSPNGKLLALIKENWKTNQRPVFIRNSGTGEERMLTDNLTARHLLWLQDNQTLLILGNDKKRESDKNYTGGMYTIDVQTGKVNQLLSFSDYRGKEWEIRLKVAQMLANGNPNQKSIYYLKNDQLLSQDLTTGQEIILSQNESFYSNNYTLELLPDQKNLLFCNEDQIYVIPTQGGTQIPIAKRITSNSLVVENSAVWSTDGNYIFYTQNKDDDSVLWQVTPDGKNPTEVWHSKFPISSLSIHPENQKIVVTVLNQESEVWKADNLLSNDEKVNKQQ